MNPYYEAAINAMFDALKQAENKHPGWPTDPIHAAAILAEEAGELCQAAIDFSYSDGTTEEMAIEAAQCAAMGLRFLLGLPHYSTNRVEQVKVP